MDCYPRVEAGLGIQKYGKEDARRVAGRGRYLADITMPGMLHAVFLRSPHAHAVIVRTDTSQAEQVAGGGTIVTYRDLAKAARALPKTFAPVDVGIIEAEAVRALWRSPCKVSTVR